MELIQWVSGAQGSPFLSRSVEDPTVLVFAMAGGKADPSSVASPPSGGSMRGGPGRAQRVAVDVGPGFGPITQQLNLAETQAPVMPPPVATPPPMMPTPQVTPSMPGESVPADGANGGRAASGTPATSGHTGFGGGEERFFRGDPKCIQRWCPRPSPQKMGRPGFIDALLRKDRDETRKFCQQVFGGRA